MRFAVVRILLPLALLMALVGAFGPWVSHRAAALVLTGQDMAEFVKFLPDVRSGELRVTRELFYLPFLAGAALYVVAFFLSAASRHSRP